MKSTDVRTVRKDGETYANIGDLIKKIDAHGTTVSTAFKTEEFKQVYILAYCHIGELLELIKNY